MSKWTCEVCGLEFENFHAQGFNHTIYCPLCYYKELYKINTKEIERLNNIINELEKWLDGYLESVLIHNKKQESDEYVLRTTIDKLQELKGDSNNE